MSDDDIADLVCLTMVPGVGPLTSRALLERFGDATGVLNASITALREIRGVGPKLADAIAAARRTNDPARELELCRRHGVEALPLGTRGYPRPLAAIPDPPALLYRRGTFEPADRLAVALVGSRRCTPYGMRVAEKLAGSLARAGLTVVSGLARGIDAAAHRGALKAGGRTIAVLANGLAEVYPPEHVELAKEVAANGALVAEVHMHQEPLPGLFPQRNRIISGLCLGVVVVEAAPKSGSLATAKHAMEQDREVFAVPGPVDSLASRGCHALIRDGARLVETVEDILEELAPKIKGARPTEGVAEVDRREALMKLSDQERTVLGTLDDTPRTVDELIGRSGLASSQVMATLSILQMRKLARREPGNMFTRC